MSSIKTVEDAIAASTAARERFMATLEDIQDRVAPSRLFDETLSSLRERSAELAQSAGQAAKDRPAVVAGAATAGLLLLVRKPLWRLGRRLLGKPQETLEGNLGLAENAPHAKG